MKKFVFFALMASFFSSSVLAVIPDSDLSYPPLRVKDTSAITEHDFNNVANLLHKIYAPKIFEKGKVRLIMNAVWSDDTVNAFATREIDTWTVHIAGGMARAKGMTKDSLALVICHELGHHLGGAPRTFLYEGWPSAEGQADYWATSKCLKNYYYEKALEEIAVSENIPEKVIRDCSLAYGVPSDVKVCVKTQLATLHFARFLNHLPTTKTPVSIDLTDSRVVKGTNTNDYPRPQCRLDTLYQGALCPIGSNVTTSEADAKIGHCNDTTKAGARPRCWYKP